MSPQPGAAIPDNISLKQLMIGLEPIVELPGKVPGEQPGQFSQAMQPVSIPTPQTTPPSTTVFASPSRTPLRWSDLRPSQPLVRTRSSVQRSQPPADPTQPPFPSFTSAPLDAQLRRYLSYVEIMGAADIIIVGSSRATQGVDPLVLQQALSKRGTKGLKVFNWGIHGATAQVVELLLTEILTPDQLPRMVVWADGSRSFSRGRYDQTFENIRRSPGYQALKQGKRPYLTGAEHHQLRSFQVALEAIPPQLSSLPSSDTTPRFNPAAQQPPRQTLRLKTLLKVKQSLKPDATLATSKTLVPLHVTQVPSGQRRFIDWCNEVQGPCSDLEYEPHDAASLWDEEGARSDRTQPLSSFDGKTDSPTADPVLTTDSDSTQFVAPSPKLTRKEKDERGLPPLPNLHRRRPVALPVVRTEETPPSNLAAPSLQNLQAVRQPQHNSATPNAVNRGPVLFDSRLYREASGFKFNDQQFHPTRYFQQHKRIPGNYDGDYQNFGLWGHQHQSLQRTLKFARKHSISIVFVSMPLNQLYLDPVRQKREAAFVTYMNKASKSRVLMFHDFSRLWPNRHEFFIDPSHVNRYGAMSVSWELGQRLDPKFLNWLEQNRRPRPTS